MPIVSFIVPLRSPDTTNNWSRVSWDCLNTIESILQQTDSDFNIYLVCNQEPEGFQANSKIHVIKDKFPTPNTLQEMRKDQRNKVKKALVEIGRTGKGHNKFIMRVDADDFVSKKLVKFVKENQNANGFFCDWGYLFQQSCNYVMLQPKFYLASGTSAIVKFHQQDFPESEDAPNNTWLIRFWAHQRIVATMEEMGRPLRKLPFIGVVHQCGTGENISNVNMQARFKANLKQILKSLVLRRKLTNNIIQEFGIKEELLK